MNALLISDLHLTAHPRDEYRWRLFDWLAEEMPKYDVRYLFILGDLTQNKDYHSAKLVNRVVNALLSTYRKTGCLGIYVLRGNHDGIDPNMSYFRFLGQYPSIKYIETPWMEPISGRELLFLPHTTTPAKAWEATDMGQADYIFMHATMNGSVVENGQTMDGVNPALLARAARAKIYSGDIHVAQKVGRVEYVGAPYPVRFGDSYQGRAVLLENFRKSRDLIVPSIGRHYVDVYKDGNDAVCEAIAKYPKGDQIKARIHLAPQDALEWQRLKELMVEACSGLELCGIELVRIAPTASTRPRLKASKVGRPVDQVYASYCKAHKISSEMENFGAQIISDVK